MDALESWLTLARVPSLHVGQLGEWFAQGRSPLELLSATPAQLAEAGLGVAATRALLHPDRAVVELDLSWLRGGALRRVITWGASDYPPLLARIPDPPLVLFVEGAASALALPQLAIVGSRNPTALGRDTATRFAAHLGRAGLAITSGLALGIDAAAHRGALQAGAPTVAVVGRGLDAVYPAENEDLAAAILRNGGVLVTDIPVGVGPVKHNFPRRNRILSGLALGTLVVEAALQSGSLITARLAAEQGREVFAMPGSIHNAVARGCHQLLRQGARLVETTEDIFQELAAISGYSAGFEAASTPQPAAQAVVALDKEYEILLDALGFEPAGLDELVARSGLETGAVASMLLILELDGRVQQQPGGRYSRRLPGR